MNYIWGVWSTPDMELHRDNMTEAQAREWVKEWEEIVAPLAKPGIFLVCRRPVGQWEVLLNDEFVTFTKG